MRKTIAKLIVIALAIIAYMALEYQARGYFAIGAEIMFLPVLWVGTLIMKSDKA